MQNLTLKKHCDTYHLRWAIALSAGLHILAVLISPFQHLTNLATDFIFQVAITHPKETPLIVTQDTLTTIKPPTPAIILNQKKSSIAKMAQKLPSIEVERNTTPLIADEKNTSESDIAPAKSTLVEATPIESTSVESPQKAESLPQESVRLDTKIARTQYGKLLAQEIAEFKQYPVFARQAKQQGIVVVELQVNNLGQLLSTRIHLSSDYELLDNQALAMVKKAAPFSPPPTNLHEHELSIFVPISFHLN